MTKKLPAVFIALPVLCEYDNLPAFLENIRKQDYAGAICLFVCVNQPEAWWDDPEKITICRDNASSLNLLRKQNAIDIKVIDRSSKGRGWIGRQHGVGFARREVMQAIADVGSGNDIMISLDADTGFGKSYVSSVAGTLHANTGATALSVPYYHRLTGHEPADRAILRYEIYMRCYAINMHRIKSPYAFTALGSAIALNIKNYKSIGGITPKMSGEDFYFLQKLRKKGPLISLNPEKVFPAARFSDRVYFGTGPAMIKGAAGDWSSYPIYHYSWFDEVGRMYSLFPKLYQQNISTPMDRFLSEIFPKENIWEKLRQNAASVEKFVWACHQKIDGLRILQYLKWRQRQSGLNDVESLMEFMAKFYPNEGIINQIKQSEIFNFASSPVNLLNQLRDFLVEKEDKLLQ